MGLFDDTLRESAATIERATVKQTTARRGRSWVATFTGPSYDAVKEAGRKWGEHRYGVTMKEPTESPSGGFVLELIDYGSD